MVDNSDDFSKEEFLNETKNLVADEQPDFDISFQHGLLGMALGEDHFCAQLCRYLGNDKDLKDFQIFDNKPTQEIFTIICKSNDKFGTRPTEGQLRQSFTSFDEDEKERLNITLNSILQTDIHNDVYYRKYVGAFVKKCKFTKGMVRIKQAWSKGNKDKDGGVLPDDVMQEVLDGIRTVEFENQNILRLADYDQLFNARANEKGTKIPTGITELDNDLLGGLPRQSLVVVLAGTNVGKSIFCTSLGAVALKAKDERGKFRGFKVLQINLEGRGDDSLFRYMSNLAQVPYKSIVTNTLTSAEQERINQAKKDFSNRLLIRNMTTFGVTIEDLVAYTREVYKDYKFDMLIVDYGQLLETRVKTENHRLAQAKVFRGLSTMSNEFNCVLISPAQGTRNAQENQNGSQFKGRNQPADSLPVMRSSDISEAFEIARVSSVILSLNRTDEEGLQGKLRVFLEKQREGAKNKQYGIFANYPMSDVITGKYYDPKSTMTRENEKVSEKDTVTLGQVNSNNTDPEVSDSDRILHRQDELDSLVEEFKAIADKENSKRLDFTQEKKKAKPNQDIIDQLDQDLQKIKAKKVEIAQKAQDAIKIIDPSASEEGLKLMQKSLHDLQRSDATDDQLNEQERIVSRYKLGLKGKI